MAISYAASRILDAYPRLDPMQVEERLAQASFASIKERFVYIEVPRAACTTMRMVLRELRGSAPLKLFTESARESRRNMFIHSRENIPFPSLNAIDQKDQRDLLEASDVLRFTVVRNPYTRLVSAWRGKVFLCESIVDVYTAIRGSTPPLEQKDPIQFAEFVSYIESMTGGLWDEHWRRQVHLAFQKAIPFTHIGKVEDLRSTITIFGHHIGRQGAIIAPRANETSIKPLAGYSKELAERVYALYQEDFATFGYGAESWPRDQNASTGVVSEERFVDEVLERNLIIAHLYSERERLMREYDIAYRFSLARVKSKLRRFLRTQPRGLDS